MDNFVILSTRKRAIIALVHSVVFLLIACATSLRTMAPLSLHSHRLAGLALLTMYGAVTSVLFLLFAVSRALKERLYFALCTTSAGTALIRIVLGDRAMHGTQYVRILALMCAIAVGTAIVRGFTPEPVLASD